MRLVRFLCPANASLQPRRSHDGAGRVALANRSLERIQDGQVTFRYRDNRTQHVRRVTLSGVEFLQRFLPACPAARVHERALLRDLESNLPSPTRSGPNAPHRSASGAHRAGVHPAAAGTGRRRSSAHALSSVSNGDLDPGERPRPATDAGAMTVSSPDVARSCARAPRVAAAPSASPTGCARVRRVRSERGVHPKDARHTRRHVQTTAPLTPRRLTTRLRSLNLQ
jgi:hypothetical protein